MTNTYLVGYDGSDASKRAVEYAQKRVDQIGGNLVLAYVLEWSPYSFLTPEEIEQRHKRRQEELDRAKSHVIDPMIKELGGKAKGVIQYGDIAETLAKMADEENAEVVVIGRQGHSGLSSRLFGSTAGKLAQISKMPCIIVP